MRKILVTSVLLLLGLAVFAQEKFTVSCTVEGGSGEAVLNQFRDGELIEIGKASVVDGKFEITGSVDFPEMHYIKVGESEGYVFVFLENSEIEISANTENLTVANVSGSNSHANYDKYNNSVASYRDSMDVLQADFQNASTEDEMEVIRLTYNVVYEEYMQTMRSFIKQNPKSFISAYLIFAYLAADIETEELEMLINGLDKSVHESYYVKQMKADIVEGKQTEIGQIAPDFTLNTPEGEPLSLSSLRGKYVLIDFWASWCGPCRRENPNVVKVYEKYGGKDFEILGVSLDEKEASWLGAIKDDGMTWVHVSDLKGWQCAASQLYKVKGIPHTVLLDKTGKIIAKDLRGDKLEEKLEELLGQ